MHSARTNRRDEASEDSRRTTRSPRRRPCPRLFFVLYKYDGCDLTFFFIFIFFRSVKKEKTTYVVTAFRRNTGPKNFLTSPNGTRLFFDLFTSLPLLRLRSLLRRRWQRRNTDTRVTQRWLTTHHSVVYPSANVRIARARARAQPRLRLNITAKMRRINTLEDRGKNRCITYEKFSREILTGVKARE